MIAAYNQRNDTLLMGTGPHGRWCVVSVPTAARFSELLVDALEDKHLAPDCRIKLARMLEVIESALRYVPGEPIIIDWRTS